MSCVARGIALCLLALTLVSCETPPAATSAASPSPSPTANTLPRPEEERAVRQALEREGARVTRVTSSKFDWLFGDAAPRAAVFETVIEGQQTWADVHFLDRSPGTIVACSGLLSTSEAFTFTVGVDGRPAVSGNGEVTGRLASGAMYFAAGERYFVMTPDRGVREALRRALALAVPPCRSPVSLPVLPWESEVVDALGRAGIELDRVGGSKFETLLGERHAARVFAARFGELGSAADVLFLDQPVPELRVCRSTASSGLARYEIFIGDRRVADVEGTADIHYSVSGRFFIQSFGRQFHEALMRGLGTGEPTC